MNTLKNVFVLLTTLCFCLPLEAIEGLYVGEMQLFQNSKIIPLSLTIYDAGEDREQPNGDIYPVLSGSFQIDEAGANYSFSSIEFDVDNAKIELQHRRISTTSSAPHFRLSGYLNAQGGFSGTVLSATRGIIGSFAIERLPLAELPAKVLKYNGHYRGFAKQAETGEDIPMSIEIVEGSTNTQNPENYEFEYTPAKLASVTWNEIRLSAAAVYIDYLTRKVTMTINGSNGTPALQVVYYPDFEKKQITGEVLSGARGKTATFVLPMVE